MRRTAGFLAVALVLAGLLAAAGAASTGTPTLRSVSASNGHLVVRFTLAPGTAPATVRVATSRSALTARLPNPGVKLSETMHASPAGAPGVERWRTQKSLPAGTYYAAVSAIVTVGVTGCVPRRADCLTRWSGARRIVVP
jgi:hypothetical protein